MQILPFYLCLTEISCWLKQRKGKTEEVMVRRAERITLDLHLGHLCNNQDFAKFEIFWTKSLVVTHFSTILISSWAGHCVPPYQFLTYPQSTHTTVTNKLDYCHAHCTWEWKLKPQGRCNWVSFKKHRLRGKHYSRALHALQPPPIQHALQNPTLDLPSPKRAGEPTLRNGLYRSTTQYESNDQTNSVFPECKVSRDKNLYGTAIFETPFLK